MGRLPLPNPRKASLRENGKLLYFSLENFKTFGMTSFS